MIIDRCDLANLEKKTSLCHSGTFRAINLSEKHIV